MSRYESVLNIIDYCKKLSEDKGDKFNIDVMINSKLSRSLGRVKSIYNFRLNKYEPICMEIGKKLVNSASDKDIEKVIAHEWCHYYLGKTSNINHNHDEVFNRLARQVGGNTGTSTQIEGYSKNYKYTVKCDCCGSIIGGYARMVNTEYKISRCCESSITLIQNY